MRLNGFSQTMATGRLNKHANVNIAATADSSPNTLWAIPVSRTAATQIIMNFMNFDTRMPSTPS